MEKKFINPLRLRFLLIAVATFAVGIATVLFLNKSTVHKLFVGGHFSSESETSYSGGIGCNGPETGYVPSSMNPNERYVVVPATTTKKAHWDKYCSGVRISFDAPCPYPKETKKSLASSGSIKKR
jgi:hypothetical protein